MRHPISTVIGALFVVAAIVIGWLALQHHISQAWSFVGAIYSALGAWLSEPPIRITINFNRPPSAPVERTD